MPQKTSTASLASPCRRICELNRADVCIGCARTRGEISEWSRATAARQAEIWQNVRARLATAQGVRPEPVDAVRPPDTGYA